MTDKYILDGKKPVPAKDILEWGRFFEDLNNRSVAQDRVSKDVHVSTVFLGIDHRWGDDGPPLLFETMIFGGPHDEYQERCSTWEEAEEQHKAAVAIAMAGDKVVRMR